MEIFRFLKGMKIEDHFPIELTFRTSRTSAILGIGLLIGGFGTLWHVCTGTPLFCFFQLIRVGSFFGGFLLLALGLFFFTYRKSVVVNRVHSRIQIVESSLFGQSESAFHFQDVLHLELCRLSEWFGATKACMWTIKVYVRRHTGFITARLFASLEATEAEEAATLLADILQRHLIREQSLPLPTGHGMDIMPNQVGI